MILTIFDSLNIIFHEYHILLQESTQLKDILHNSISLTNEDFYIYTNIFRQDPPDLYCNFDTSTTMIVSIGLDSVVLLLLNSISNIHPLWNSLLAEKQFLNFQV